MSTLSVGTIKSTGTSPPTVQNSSGTQIGTFCRAWVNFDGTTSTPTIRAAFNVSSITDGGTGIYTVNFTNALPDANYAAVATTSDDSRVGNVPSASVSSSSLVVRTLIASNSALTDQAYVAVSVFR